MDLLVATLVLAIPAVRVDGSALVDDAHGRRIVGHVVERLLEVGIAVDPHATTGLVLSADADGYTIALRDQREELVEHVASAGRELAIIELDVVQVAVELARDHATADELTGERVHVVVGPGAEQARAELLALLTARGSAIVPDDADATAVVCVDAGAQGFAIARADDARACELALTDAPEHASMRDAVEALHAKPPAVAVLPVRVAAPVPPSAPTPTRRRGAGLGPWSFGARVGIGFAWRPRAFDAAPAIGFEAASRAGLALGLDASVLPSRSDTTRTADTLLAAGIGYRATFSHGLHLSALATGGIAVHRARVGDERDTRVDPLLALPIQLEGDLHRNVALGLRFTVATTLRARTHAINGIEVWHRGPVLLMLAATVRFGT